MLAMVFIVVPGLFGSFLWTAYRSDKAKSGAGQGYQPPAGRQRWTSDSDA